MRLRLGLLRWGLPALLLSCRVLAADVAVPRGPLPDDVRPERYRLQLDIDPRLDRFSGVTEIDVRVEHPLRTVWMHGRGLDVHDVKIEVAGRTVQASYVEADPVTGVARLDVPETLPAGPATLRFEYDAKFRDGGEGLYRDRMAGEVYAFTQFEAIDARRAFPGFDEPRFKTPFDVTIRARGSDKVVTNTLQKSSRPLAGGRVEHVFQTTLPLPTYLLLFAVGPLDIVDGVIPPNSVRPHPLPFRAVATKGKGPLLAYAMQHTPDIVRELESYFGTPHPYPKLDVIASPGMLGAMENAGAILFQDTLLLLDDHASPAQLRGFYEVMSHELAHQWFGDLVTPRWWDDLWLNESFAEWMGLKIAEKLRPDFHFRASLVDEATAAMDVDSRKAGRPIHQPIDDNAQVNDAFDAITYQKGAGVLTMVEEYLGEDRFREGVRLHLQRHAHGVADSGQFFDSMAQASRQPEVIAAFRSFTDQMGVPLVSLRPGADAGAWSLSQARYRPIGLDVAGDPGWRIPVCVRSYGDGPEPATRTCTLLSERTGVLQVPAGTTALMPNADGAGYYRFALPPAYVARLTARAATLPETEAIAFADSVGAAYVAGALAFGDLLDAARALSLHPSRSASYRLGRLLVRVKNSWAAGDPAARTRLEAELRSVYGPRLADLGELDLRRGAYATEAADRRLRRTALVDLVGLEGRDPALRKTMTSAAQASIKEAAALDPEFRALAWSVAVQDLGATFATPLRALLVTSKDSALRGDAAIALGAAVDPQSARLALSLMSEVNVPVLDALRAVDGQFEQPTMRDAAWTWYRENFDVIFRRMPDIFQSSSFGVARVFCDAGHRAEAATLLIPKARAIGTGELEVERALEDIDLCIAQKSALLPNLLRATR